jgi:dienelactone hydrolase
MRPLEALLILGAASAIIRGSFLSDLAWLPWTPLMPIAIAVLLALHLFFEGWRPQMMSAYAVIIILLLLAVIPVPAVGGFPGQLAGGMGLGLLAAAGCLCVLRPVIQTPSPTGAFAVGTTIIPLLDDAAVDGPVFRVWYPAKPRSGRDFAPYLNETRPWPGFNKRHARLGRTQSMLDAALIDTPARLPILVFFPGWGGRPSQNTVLLQDLASHGYIVAAPDAWDRRAYPHDTAAAADLATPLAFDSDEAAALSLRVGARNAPRLAWLARHLADRLAALDAAEPAGRFTGRLELDKIGILGFSFGGSVAIQAAMADPRFRAVANLDGQVFTDAYLRGFSQPYLLLSEPVWTDVQLRSPNPWIRRAAVSALEDESRVEAFLARWGGIRLIIDGVAHENFKDAPLLQTWRRPGGAIDPRRARLIVTTFLLAFFDHALRSAPRPVPDCAQGDYPDIRLQIWPRPTVTENHMTPTSTTQALAP